MFSSNVLSEREVICHWKKRPDVFEIIYIVLNFLKKLLFSIAARSESPIRQDNISGVYKISKL